MATAFCGINNLGKGGGISGYGTTPAAMNGTACTLRRARGVCEALSLKQPPNLYLERLQLLQQRNILLRIPHLIHTETLYHYLFCPTAPLLTSNIFYYSYWTPLPYLYLDGGVPLHCVGRDS